MGLKGKDELRYRKVPSKDVGLHAPRGCTNMFFLFLFFAFWALMAYVCVIAYKLGDLDRLIYGVDYEGNVCSRGDAPNLDFSQEGHQGSDVTWKKRTKLWYPITYTKEHGFLVRDALKLGVCVETCPPAYDDANHDDMKYLLSTYRIVSNGTNFGPLSPYLVYFNSTERFNRCMPDLLTFRCDLLPWGMRDTCHKSLNKTSVFADDIYGMLEDGFAELKHNWWIIFACTGIAIVVCFLWMFCLRRMVKPLVVVTMVLIFIALVLLGYFLFLRSKSMEKQAPNDDTHKWYFYGSIAVWVVTFLYLCVVAFLFKEVMVACDIIEEASKIPISIPTMMLVPVVAVLFLIPLVVFAVFTSAHIYTAAKSINLELPQPKFNGHISNSTVEVKSYTSENWRTYAHIYNLFIFLWTAGFLNAIAFLTLAFCCIFWYWSNPGDDKKPEAGVWKGFTLTFLNHLGTLALGSMIIAIIQVIRVVLSLMEKHMQTLVDNNTAAKFCIKCAECCLACFERIIQFINKNAYIVTAMTGEPFLDAARHALHLLMSNVLSVGAVTIVGEYVMGMGKILITAGVTGICYAIQRKAERTDGYGNGLLVLVVVAVLSYFVAMVFINVLGVCIDSVLLSYCYDLESNNGLDSPYYFPSDLAKHVKRAEERMKLKKQNDKRGSDAEMEKPLNRE